jgi:hypothetical protein
MTHPSTLRLILNAAALAAASPTLFLQRLVECRALETKRVRVVEFQSPFQCVFSTALPIAKLFAWGGGDSGGHVL